MDVSFFPSIDFAITLLWIVIGVLVVAIEIERRNGRQAIVANMAPARMGFFVRAVCECAPEILGVVLCLAVAAALRTFGDTSNAYHNMPPQMMPVWQRIKSEWPVLVCADTLLTLSAMVRLIGFTSTALRSMRNAGAAVKQAGAQFAEWPILLMLCSATARVTLAGQTSAYGLDGPLGGRLPNICEMIALVPLGLLAQRASRKGVITVAAMTAAAAYIAQKNYFNLTNMSGESNSQLDSLFMVSTVLELFGAISYLGCTTSQTFFQRGFANASGGAAACFVHAAMAAQSALTAYYWLHIDAGALKIGEGRPLCIQRITALLAFGAFSGVMCLKVAAWLEGAERQPSALLNESEINSERRENHEATHSLA